MPITSVFLDNYFLNPGTRYNLVNIAKAAKDIKNKKNLRRRIYDNLDPRGSYNDPVEHMARVLVGNYSDFSSKDNKYNDVYRTLTKSWGPADDGVNQSKAHDELMAKYLGITTNLHKRKGESLKKSKYKPSLSKNSNTEYYSLPITTQQLHHLLSRVYAPTAGLPLKYNENAVVDPSSTGFGGDILGNYTVSKGRDKKGDYVSYYDVFDLNPFKGEFAKYSGNNIPFINTIDDLGMGTPVELYDRFYLDDVMGLPADAKKGTVWLPPLVVKYNKKTKYSDNYFDFQDWY